MFEKPVLLPYQIINVQGADAAKFLQGQLSCDVDALEIGAVTIGTANTPKGRIYGLFLLTKQAESSFLLRIHESCTENFLSTLGKYAVFFKCELQLAENHKAYGCLTDSIPADVAENGATIILPWDQKRAEIWTDTLLEEAHSAEQDIASWLARDTQCGVPEVYDNTTDQFILQQINLQQLGAVSFTKGCYTGQEIIARMKYLGKNKKAMYLLETSEKVTLRPGTKLIDSAGKQLGEWVRAHWDGEKTTGLAVMNKERAETGEPIETEDESNRSYTLSLSEPSYEQS